MDGVNYHLLTLLELRSRLNQHQLRTLLKIPTLPQSCQSNSIGTYSQHLKKQVVSLFLVTTLSGMLVQMVPSGQALLVTQSTSLALAIQQHLYRLVKHTQSRFAQETFGDGDHILKYLQLKQVQNQDKYKLQLQQLIKQLVVSQFNGINQIATLMLLPSTRLKHYFHLTYGLKSAMVQLQLLFLTNSVLFLCQPSGIQQLSTRPLAILSSLELQHITLKDGVNLQLQIQLELKF